MIQKTKIIQNIIPIEISEYEIRYLETQIISKMLTAFVITRISFFLQFAMK